MGYWQRVRTIVMVVVEDMSRSGGGNAALQCGVSCCSDGVREFDISADARMPLIS